MAEIPGGESACRTCLYLLKDIPGEILPSILRDSLHKPVIVTVFVLYILCIIMPEKVGRDIKKELAHFYLQKMFF